jgi:hypothetical protein
MGDPPPDIPNSDKEEFQAAAAKLKDYKERLAKAKEQEEAAKDKTDDKGKKPAKSQSLRDPLCACNGLLLPMHPGGVLPSPNP